MFLLFYMFYLSYFYTRAISRKPRPTMLNRWSPIWLVFIYVIGASVWWISAQAVWKNIVPFSRYSNFAEGTIVKKARFLQFFVSFVSHQGYIHWAWNFYCEYIICSSTSSKNMSSKEWTINESTNIARYGTKLSFFSILCTYISHERIMLRSWNFGHREVRVSTHSNKKNQLSR